MNWDAIGAVGEIIGAAAVVVVVRVRCGEVLPGIAPQRPSEPPMVPKGRSGVGHDAGRFNESTCGSRFIVRHEGCWPILGHALSHIRYEPWVEPCLSDLKPGINLAHR